MTSPEMAQAAESTDRELRSLARLSIAFLISLYIARCFLAEPNHIPSGSMAPHRLGIHQSWICSNCNYPFHAGMRLDGTFPQAVCPNCGHFNPVHADSVFEIHDGERIWVDKTAFQLNPVERFDEIVFFSPDDPLTPYIKRAVGLPGESVQIQNGDLFINGKRYQKTSKERIRTSIPVYDQNYNPANSFVTPRWKFQSGHRDESADSSEWIVTKENAIELKSERSQRSNIPAFYEAMYLHFCPNRNAYGPVSDFLDYNGRNIAGEHVVNDLWFNVELTNRTASRSILRLTNESVNIEMTIAFDAPLHTSQLKINDTLFEPTWHVASNIIPGQATHQYQLSCVDRQLQFLIDNHTAFVPINLESYAPRRPDESLLNSPSGIAFNGPAVFRNFMLYRDIFITDRTADNPVTGHGVAAPVQLDSTSFFVLGDNSPFSIDSRFWKHGPAVSTNTIIGEPMKQWPVHR